MKGVTKGVHKGRDTADSTGGRVICLLGPTGTGKSSLAVALAREWNAEVVNFDSRQVYRSFPLITAQPERNEYAACRHWLYGFLECHESVDVGQFCALARERVAEITSRGRLPLLVGGTGLYLRSFFSGLAPIPKIPSAVRSRVLKECRDHGPEALHGRLHICDPETAERVHPRDRQRVTRALEVYAATGKPISWWHQRQAPGTDRCQALKIGIWVELETLTPRLQARIETMLARGALDEVRQAWTECPEASAPGWSGIGCREILDCHLGRSSLEQARQEWLRRTRAYAKRQLTWFQKEDGVHWLGGGELEKARELVQAWSSARAAGFDGS